MNTPNATPGPWHINAIGYNGICDEIIGDGTSKDALKFSIDGNAHVCMVDRRSSPSSRADAALIAAAPELYEALSLVMDKLTIDDCNCNEHPCTCGYWGAIAALKKARGEE